MEYFQAKLSSPFASTIYQLFFILLLSLFASTSSANDWNKSFSFQIENDRFGSGADQHYTNGWRFSTTVKEDREKTLQVLNYVANQLPGMGTECASDVDWLYNFSVGQNMFTPEDIWDPNAYAIYKLKGDRPYAGWFYVNFGLLSDKRYLNDNSKIKETCEQVEQIAGTLDTLELSVGIIGPASKAGETQEFVHKTFGGVDPKGWHHQLKNEPAINLTYSRQWRYESENPEQNSWFDWDVIPHYGFALGNVYTYANAGATLRMGKGLRNDYGPPRIRPSIPGSDFVRSNSGKDLSGYVFAGVEGRAIARNIFLDGNTFVDSHSVEKYPLVGDIQAGGVLRYKNTQVSLTTIHRSREFKRQQEASNFGALTLTYLFE